MASLPSCLQAGVLSSLASLAVFLGVHHLWIRPIWFIAPAGAAIAVAGGLALGWSWFLLQPGLPGLPWSPLAALALIAVILAPGVALSFTHGPLFDLQTADIPAGQGRAVAIRFLLELVVTATVVGALVGWRLGGTGTAALATSLAGLALALGPGHNIPMFGHHPVAFKGLAILLALSLVTAVGLPVGVVLLERIRAG